MVSIVDHWYHRIRAPLWSRLWKIPLVLLEYASPASSSLLRACFCSGTTTTTISVMVMKTTAHHPLSNQLPEIQSNRLPQLNPCVMCFLWNKSLLSSQGMVAALPPPLQAIDHSNHPTTLLTTNIRLGECKTCRQSTCPNHETSSSHRFLPVGGIRMDCVPKIS